MFNERKKKMVYYKTSCLTKEFLLTMYKWCGPVVGVESLIDIFFFDTSRVAQTLFIGTWGWERNKLLSVSRHNEQGDNISLETKHRLEHGTNYVTFRSWWM